MPESSKTTAVTFRCPSEVIDSIDHQASTTDLESAADFYNLEPDKYLEELSGWQCRPIEPGSSRTRFYPPK